MTAYADREDVLRVLGGVLETVQEHFSLRLWDGGFPLTSVTVDDNTFDMPDTLLARIDAQLVFACSKVDAYILKAYEAKPPSVPPHLRLNTAQLATYHVLVTDGVKTEYIKALHAETIAFLKDLAAKRVDLGIVAPRPKHRAPAALIATGVGTGVSRRRRRGGCCC